MVFKIVQTIEKGIPRLSVIPSVWEEKGKLFWPSEKTKNRARLVRDEKSFPSPSWDILDCIVKRNNIPTYKEAEAEIKIMENQTDTDTETVAGTYRRRPSTDCQIQNVNFENLAQDLMNVGISYPSNQEPEETLNIMPVLDSDQLIVNQNILYQRINDQNKILNDISENLKKLTQKVAILSVQLDDSVARILEKIDQPMSVTLLKEAAVEDNESFSLKQIDSKKQLENLEMALMDKSERSKLKKQLSFLFQPSEGNGITFAYKLLDSLISRNFLCECSWSGGSRGQHSKIALKDFKNFLKFFCDMIRSWDSTFTMAQTEHFLKTTLKNALKRQSMKDLRSSSKRVRKTKPKTRQGNKPSTSNESVKSLDVPNSDLLNAEAEENKMDEDSDADLC